MRTPRTELFTKSGKQTVLISNRTHKGMPIFSHEDRAMLRGFIENAARDESFELLAWCYLPTSYRIILRGRLDTPHPIDPNDHSAVQSYPLARFAKKAFVRLGHWRNFRKVESLVWQARFKSTALISNAEQLAGALSVDVHPVLYGLADNAEDYYFCSFHDACAGNKTAQRGIARLVGMPNDEWSEVRASYRRSLQDLHKRVSDLV